MPALRRLECTSNSKTRSTRVPIWLSAARRAPLPSANGSGKARGFRRKDRLRQFPLRRAAKRVGEAENFQRWFAGGRSGARDAAQTSSAKLREPADPEPAYRLGLPRTTP